MVLVLEQVRCLVDRCCTSHFVNYSLVQVPLCFSHAAAVIRVQRAIVKKEEIPKEN